MSPNFSPSTHIPYQITCRHPTAYPAIISHSQAFLTSIFPAAIYPAQFPNNGTGCRHNKPQDTGSTPHQEQNWMPPQFKTKSQNIFYLSTPFAFPTFPNETPPPKILRDCREGPPDKFLSTKSPTRELAGLYLRKS